jgi:hypothetical protein
MIVIPSGSLPFTAYFRLSDKQVDSGSFVSMSLWNDNNAILSSSASASLAMYTMSFSNIQPGSYTFKAVQSGSLIYSERIDMQGISQFTSSYIPSRSITSYNPS